MNKQTNIAVIMLLSCILSSNMTARNNFWNGFEDIQENLEQTRKNIDRAFGQINSDENQVYMGNASIFESKNGEIWGLEFYVPGYTKSDFSIQIDKNGFLHIKAESKKEEKENKEDKDKKYIYKSWSSSARTFIRTIKLPEFVEYSDSSKIETSYNEKNGKLEIKFPKKDVEAKKDIIELKLK